MMRGFGGVTGTVGLAIVVLFACSFWACNKEDVAPRMVRPMGDRFDGPVQEEPEPPPGGMQPADDGSSSRTGDDGRLAAASDGQENLPPPPEGDSIPLESPPLPEGVRGVKIAGTVVYSGYEQGLIQIDVSDLGMDGGHNRGARPKIIQLYRMEKPGPFEMEVPENQGKIYISAYNDADKNGRPTRGEPRGQAKGNPYKIGSEDVTGVEIVLAKERIPPPPP